MAQSDCDTISAKNAPNSDKAISIMDKREAEEETIPIGLVNKTSVNNVKSLSLGDVNENSKCLIPQAEKINICKDKSNDILDIDHISVVKKKSQKNVQYGYNPSSKIASEDRLQSLQLEFFDEKEKFPSSVDYANKKVSQNNLKYDDFPSCEITTENRYKDLKKKFLDDKKTLSSLHLLKMETGNYETLNQENNSPNLFNSNSMFPTKDEFFKDQLENFIDHDEIKISHKQSRISRFKMDKCLDYYEAIKKIKNGTSTIIFKSLLCPYSNAKEDQVIKHSLAHKKNRNFNCLDCDFSAKCLFHLKLHKKTHVENYFECPICQFSTTSVTTLRAHRYRKHLKQSNSSCTASNLRNRSTISKTTYVCNKCTFTTTDIDSYQNHIKTCNGRILSSLNGEEPVRSTGKQAKDISGVKTTKLVERERKKFVCGKCSFVTDNAGNLSKHKQTHLKPSGNKDSFVVDLSENKLYLEGSLSQNLFCCSHCSFTTSLKIALLKHKQSHVSSPPGVFKCTECSFSASNNKSLISHLLTHAYKYLHRCIHCNFSSSNKATLRSHKMSHKKLRQKTNYRFYSKNKITVQLQAKNNKTFQCFSCDYSCSSEYLLNQHSLTHLEYKLFSCDHCNYRTNFKGNFAKHVKIHASTYRPYGLTNETEIKHDVDSLPNKSPAKNITSSNLASGIINYYAVLNKCPNLPAEKMKVCSDKKNVDSGTDNIWASKKSRMKTVSKVKNGNNKNHNVSGKNVSNSNCGSFSSVRNGDAAEIERDDREREDLDNISSESSHIDLDYDGPPSPEIDTENQYHDQENEFLCEKLHSSPDVSRMKTDKRELKQNVTLKNKKPNTFKNNLISPIENHKKLESSQKLNFNDEEIKPNHNSHERGRVTSPAIYESLDGYEVIKRKNNGTSAVIFKSTVCPYTSIFKYKMVQHLCTHKKNKNYKCSDCDFTAKCLFLLKCHKKTHVENYVECPLCQFSTTSLSTLNRHRLTKHEKQKNSSFSDSKLRTRSTAYVCNKCTFTTTNMDIYQKHTEICNSSQTKHLKRKNDSSKSVSKKHQRRSTGKQTKETYNVKIAKSAKIVMNNNRYRNLSIVNMNCFVVLNKRLNVQAEVMKLCRNNENVSSDVDNKSPTFKEGSRMDVVCNDNAKVEMTAENQLQDIKSEFLDIEEYNSSVYLVKEESNIEENDSFSSESNAENHYEIKGECHSYLDFVKQEENQMDLEWDNCPSGETTIENRYHDLMNKCLNDEVDLPIDLLRMATGEHESFSKDVEKGYESGNIVNSNCSLFENNEVNSYEVIRTTNNGTETIFFKSLECPYITTFKSKIIHHLSIHKKNRNYNCIDCKNVNTIFECEKCNFNTDSLDNLLNHKQTHTKLSKKGKRFVDDLPVDQLKEPESNISLTCNSCSFSSSLKIALLKHKQSHVSSPPGVFRCTECSFSTSSNKKMSWHLNNHAYKYVYRCTHCNFSTNNKGTLRVHKNSHSQRREKTNIRNYRCNKLSISIMPKNNMMLKCSQCEYSSFSKYLLKQHSFTHLKYKRFKCIYCDYKTNFKGNLVKHVMIHVSEYT